MPKTKVMVFLQYKKHIFESGFVGLTDQEIRKIREAISRASSLEEVERLQRLLQSGHIPGQENDAQNGKKNKLVLT